MTAVTLLNRLRQLSQEKQEVLTREINASTPATDAFNRKKEMPTGKEESSEDVDVDETNNVHK